MLPSQPRLKRTFALYEDDDLQRRQVRIMSNFFPFLSCNNQLVAVVGIALTIASYELCLETQWQTHNNV